MRKLIKTHPIKASLLLIWIVILVITKSYWLIPQYGSFLFLGVLGAVFANATGAGGGVVFVPFFNQMGISSEAIVATSFAIQCCGMSAGAITWFNYYRSIQSSDHQSNSLSTQWQHLGRALMVCVPLSIFGVLSAQYALQEYTDYVQAGLNLYFGLFSIILALAIYGSIFLMRTQRNVSNINSIDIVMLVIISYFGGIITAWLSVGVGELVAVYLILRGFNVSFAIAVAVIITAFTVQAAVVYHLLYSKAIYWQVLVFAGAGAVVGGVIAKHLVLFFSPVKLKIFFATWVLVMGIAGLPVWE